MARSPLGKLFPLEMEPMEIDNQIGTPTRVRIADLLRLPEFALLTDKQAAFTALYVSSGFLTGKYDAADAAARVYKTKDEKSAAALGAELLGQRKIRTVLDAHFGRNALDALLTDLQKAIKRGLRKGNKKFQVITPEVAQALLLFEKYITAKGNVSE
jgi:hypothetical protein